MQIHELMSKYYNLATLYGDPTIDEAVIEEAMATIQGEISEMLLQYARIVTHLEADVMPLEKEIARLEARKNVLKNRIKRLKRWMLQTMTTAGLRKVKDDLFTVRIQKNSQPSVEISDGATVPNEYLKPGEPDKTALMKAIQGGTEIQGIMIVKGEHLRIA